MKMERKLKEEDPESIIKLKTKLRIEQEELFEMKEKQSDIRWIYSNMKIEQNERIFQRDKILQEIEEFKEKKNHL